MGQPVMSLMDASCSNQSYRLIYGSKEIWSYYSSPIYHNINTCQAYWIYSVVFKLMM